MKSLTKNFAYNIVYQMLIIILPLITAPYISRTLGPTGIGIYSYTYSVVYYFQLFAMLGISNHGNRSIAAVRDDRIKISQTFYQIYTIQKITFTIAILLYLIYIYLFNVDNIIIALIQILYLASGLVDISWFFFGIEEFKLTVSRNTIIKITTTVLVFIFVRSSNDTWKYTLILAGGTFFSQVYLWAYLRKYIDKTKIELNDLKKHIVPILTLFIPVIAYSIYKVMDKIMLGNMCSYEQVGFYQNAEKIINIPTGIITALGTVMLPRMSNLASHGESEKAKSYLSVSFKVVTIIGSAITFGLIAVADVFTPLFYGKGYDECINLIRILSLTVLFMAWANVIRTQYLIPQHKDKVYIVSTFVGAIVNLIINLLLIPEYYAIGAAIGTVFAEFSVWLIQIIMIHNELSTLQYFIKQIPYLLTGIIMCAFVFYLSTVLSLSVISLILLVILGGSIYCLLIFVYSYIIHDEIFELIVNTAKKYLSKPI